MQKISFDGVVVGGDIRPPWSAAELDLPRLYPHDERAPTKIDIPAGRSSNCREMRTTERIDGATGTEAASMTTPFPSGQDV
jgi:hypothetical protein